MIDAGQFHGYKMTHTVLLVDDDVELVDLLRDYLNQEGFAVLTAHDGAAGLAALSASVDMVVLDVMMPGFDGIETLTRIRASSTVPVIMLTARGDEADRIAGLELGADDYVPKPCTPRELTARIRAILKRAGTTATPLAYPITIGTLTIWPAQRRAERSGQRIELTSTEFSLVELLVRKAGQAVTKAELSQEALGRPLTPFDRSIDVHMSSIRHKLGRRPDGRSSIQTVIRKGYQLIVD